VLAHGGERHGRNLTTVFVVGAVRIAGKAGLWVGLSSSSEKITAPEASVPLTHPSAEPNNSSSRRRAVFRRLSSTAPMATKLSHHVPRCRSCDARKIEIYDPITDCAAVYCAECGDELMRFRELVSELEARIVAQERERRLRHLH
jgi:hypothetical protein